MARTAEKRVSNQLLLAGLLAVVIPALGLLAWGMVQKGVWFDEQWSKWMSSRELDLAEAAAKRWFQDVHPPLFYYFNWSVSAIVGPGVVAHRWLNLLWLAALGGVGAYIATVRPAMRPSLVVGALLIFSNRDIQLFGEYRSYALIFCATGVLMMLLHELITRADDLAWPNDLPLAAMLGATIVVILNLHYITSLIAGMTVLVFTLEQLRLRHWRWAMWMSGAAAIGSLLVLATLAAEQDYIKVAAPGFWFDSPFRYAYQTVLGKFVYATGLNLVVISCFLAVLAQRAGLISTQPGDDPGPIAWRFTLLATSAIVISVVALLAINEFKSIIHSRYLIALGPMTIMIFAVLTSGRIVSRRWIFALFVVNALVVAAWRIYAIPKKPAWDEGARLVAAQLRTCPATLVYSMWTAQSGKQALYRPLPNELPFITWAMDDIGKQYRFPVRFLAQGQHVAPPPLSPAPCPTLLWMENVYFLDPAMAVERAGLVAAANGLPLGVTRTGTGAVIAIPPDPSAIAR